MSGDAPELLLCQQSLALGMCSMFLVYHQILLFFIVHFGVNFGFVF